MPDNRLSKKLKSLPHVLFGSGMSCVLVYLCVFLAGETFSSPQFIFDLFLGIIGSLILILIVKVESNFISDANQKTSVKLIVRAFIHTLIILGSINLTRYW